MNLPNKIETIKKCSKEEVKSILLFHNGNFGQSQWSENYLASFFNSEMDGTVCGLVKNEGKIIGMVIGKTDRYNFGRMVLRSIAVDVEFRKQGYAKKLLEFFIEQSFQEKGVCEILLGFRESRRLEEFYATFGFKKVEASGKYKDGEKKILMILEK